MVSRTAPLYAIPSKNDTARGKRRARGGPGQTRRDACVAVYLPSLPAPRAVRAIRAGVLLRHLYNTPSFCAFARVRLHRTSFSLADLSVVASKRTSPCWDNALTYGFYWLLWQRMQHDRRSD